MGVVDKKKLTIGGQAVIEGVMIRSPNFYSVAVRLPNKKISVTSKKVDTFFSRHKIFKKPFIRGISQLIDMLQIGIESLTHSANESSGEKEDEKLSFTELFFTIFIAFLMAIILFILLPLYLSKIITNSDGFLFNFIDGVIRILLFLIYLLIISRLKDVKRIFEYHGAEHKTVHCYEKGLPLNIKNVKKYSSLHSRCGTSFIMIVLVLSIIIFSFVITSSFWLKFLSRLILIPIIAGISYEFLKLFARYEHNPLVAVLLYPGMLIQRLTTKNPDDKQIEVAIQAVKKVLILEKKAKKS